MSALATAAALLLIGTVRVGGQPTDTNAVPEPVSLGLLEAVRQTLAQDANIQLSQEQVEIAKGTVQRAAGQFDATLDTRLGHASANIPRSQVDIVFPPDEYTNLTEMVTHETLYELRVRKQFRSGITVSPGFDVSRYQDNLDQEFAGGGAVNRANVSFLIRVPLLRGRGKASTGALEHAAKVGQEAAVLELEQAISERILNTVIAYWTSLAAQRQLKVLKEAEELSADLVTAVTAVVNIDELPRSEQQQAEADHAAKMAARIRGEQEYWAARQRLAQALAMPVQGMTTPPVPAGDFPQAASSSRYGGGEIGAVLARSLDRRADYLAGMKQQEAAEILERAASRDLKPRLDLNLEVGYAALDEGNQLRYFFGSLDPSRAAGPNAMGTLVLEWPFANRRARGLLVQRQAARRQSQLRLDDLARTVYSKILIAQRDLLGTRGELEKSEEAERQFFEARKSQEDKVRLGTATILDLINLTDRYNAAKLNAISARARHAVALAQLRFEMGRLVARGGTPEGPLRLEDLTTLPNWN